MKYFHPGKYYEQLIYPLGDTSTAMVWRHFDLWKDWDNMKGVLYLPEQPLNAVPKNYIL
jgi:hypothetical protein